MVRRKSHRVHRRVGHAKPGFKKCVISTMRSTKFKTAKQARKAFSKASKKCNKKLAMKGKKTRKGKKTTKRHCKYGHRKGSKRCRKTPKRR